MSTARAIAWNTIVQFAARIVGSIAQALVVIILARTFVEHLGPTEGVREMGRYTTIFAFTILFGTFSEFGFFPTLVKEFSQKETRSREILAKAIPLRLLVGFLVAAIGIILAFILKFEPVVTVGIILLALSTLWNAVSNTLVSFFQSRLLMVYPALAEVAGRVIGFAVVAAAALAGAPLLTIVVLSLLGFLVTFGANLLFARRFVGLGWTIDIPYWKELARHAVPVGLISVLALIYFKIDTVMLAAMRDQFDVGVYGIPYKMVDVLVAFPSLFMGNVFPVLARALVDPDRSQRVFRRALDFLAASGFPVAVGIFVLATPIINLVGGETYLSASAVSWAGIPITAVTVLRLIVWAVLFSFFGNLLSAVIILKNMQSRYVWAAAAAVLFNIGTNYLVIPRYSYLGTSVTTLLTELVVAIPGWYLVLRMTHFRPEWAIFRKSAVAAAVMGVVIWPLQGLPFVLALLIGIPLGALVYVGLMHLFGGFSWEMVRDILRKTPAAVG
jgi:O-antigen/teichoic acid export membrane protein